MDNADFSPEFLEFVRSTMPSIDSVELLLLLQSEPDRWWRPSEAGVRLRSGAGLGNAESARLTAMLRDRALLASANGRVCYRPANPHIAAHVDRLAREYRERPVTLIRLIYELRDAEQAQPRGKADTGADDGCHARH
jgi:hypothetical protein